MKMNALAYASINQLALIELRIEPCEVEAEHQFKMQPAPIDRFVYITKGNCCFYFENRKLYAGERDMIYLPCELAYRSQWLSDSKFMVIDLLLHNADGNPIRFDESPNILFHDVHGAYRGLLEELSEKATANGPFDWLERLSLSFKLLCEMARDTNRTELDEQKRKIKEALTYLEHNYTQDFTVDQLARMCCLSVSSFRKRFTECMGTSPVEYRNRLRIQRAVTLLKNGEHTVTEAADAVGIHDMKYFGKLFKRYAGVTPRKMKKH